jgi:hypothetical protein
MEYNLKDKIEVNNEFISDLTAKSWQEVEALQQQIANIDMSTRLGNEVVKALRSVCTGYYVLIGCLEALTEAEETDTIEDKPEGILDEPVLDTDDSEDFLTAPIVKEASADFEPFEYFVDFDEPTGLPLADEDLYNI